MKNIADAADMVPSISRVRVTPVSTPSHVNAMNPASGMPAAHKRYFSAVSITPESFVSNAIRYCPPRAYPAVKTAASASPIAAAGVSVC